MPYARPREVRDAFQSLIAQNKTVRRDLESSLQDTRRRRSEAVTTLTAKLENIAGQIYRTMDKDAFAALGFISNQGNIGQRILLARADSVRAQAAYDDYVAAHGDTAQVAAEKGRISAELKQTRAILAAGAIEYKKIKDALDVASRFYSSNTGRNRLVTEEDAAYFSSKKGLAHIWSLMCDAHYREGRKVLRHYAAQGTTPAALWAQEREHVRVHEPLYTVERDLEADLSNIEKTEAEAQRLKKLIASEADIQFSSVAEIVRLLGDKKILSHMAKSTPQYVSDSVVESWVKADAFIRMEDKLEKQIASLDKMTAALERPMYKLGQAVSRAPSKNIFIDLQDINRKCQTQQVLSRHLARESSKVNARVGAFSTTGPRVQMKKASSGMDMASFNHNPFDFWTAYMVWSLLDDAAFAGAVDPATVQMTLGIPAAAADAANIDLGNISIQLGADTLNGLDGLNIDASQLDSIVSNLDVSVPDISVPDISVPDISVDFGGGGFDGGGIGGFD